ncbi:MAG: hypothetical protein IPM25_04175 [Chloracidobacterium sp.]|nr:hypothetical protein [Chloracidobacterium sp.]
MRSALILLSLAFVLGCQTVPVDPPVTDASFEPQAATAPTQSPSPTPEAPVYPGVTIDQQFPIIQHFSSIDDDGREGQLKVEAAGYTVNIKDYVPRSLEKDGKIVFTFKKREPEGYWGTLVARSQLTGKDGEQIYIAVSGPGGVCCTNYSIIDVSQERPKSIFHSEDFGSFRDPMEIFDADGDGVYELVQFDSCMRYFMDDCGSCSPEPRVHFKWSKTKRKYLPARGIQQDFVREGMSETAKWIVEKSKEFKETREINAMVELNRAVLSHVGNLLHIGEEAEAWSTLDKYYAGNDLAKARREFKRRLSRCKFYQHLKGKR